MLTMEQKAILTKDLILDEAGNMKTEDILQNLRVIVHLLESDQNEVYDIDVIYSNMQIIVKKAVANLSSIKDLGILEKNKMIIALLVDRAITLIGRKEKHTRDEIRKEQQFFQNIIYR